jgi:hypothetical protein
MAGRPPKEFTPEEISMIERYAGIGATHIQIAYMLGISPRSLSDRLNADQTLCDAIDRGRSKAAMKVMATAYEMATSGQDTAMTIFWLKTRCGWRDVKDAKPDDQESVDQIKKMPTSELIKLVKQKVG